MQLSPQSEKELNGTEPPPSVILVREQLRRLLAHPLFTNSKRYPVLLAYTVEQALDGNASELKERTIGVEAFGREPSYDVNLDPVVRITAAEVRKRLIQYYYNSDHAGELVIEMPVGSYVPTFRGPSTPPAVSAAESVSGQKIGDVVPGQGSGRADAAATAFQTWCSQLGLHEHRFVLRCFNRLWHWPCQASQSGIESGTLLGAHHSVRPAGSPIASVSPGTRLTMCDSWHREHGCMVAWMFRM